MHWRYRLRQRQLLDECEVRPEVFDGVVQRLAEFAQPFVDCLGRREQQGHARTYPAGLTSDPGRKNTGETWRLATDGACLEKHTPRTLVQAMLADYVRLRL